MPAREEWHKSMDSRFPGSERYQCSPQTQSGSMKLTASGEYCTPSNEGGSETSGIGRPAKRLARIQSKTRTGVARIIKQAWLNPEKQNPLRTVQCNVQSAIFAAWSTVVFYFNQPKSERNDLT
jgi:hypothetical protein